jgi:hypothetical protein
MRGRVIGRGLFRLLVFSYLGGGLVGIGLGLGLVFGVFGYGIGAGSSIL